MKMLGLLLSLTTSAYAAHAQTLTKMWTNTATLCEDPHCQDYWLAMGPMVSDGVNNIFGAWTDWGSSQDGHMYIFDYNTSTNTVTSSWGAVANSQLITSNLIYANGKVWWGDGLIGGALYSWTPGANNIVSAPNPNNYEIGGTGGGNGIVSVTASNGDVLIYGISGVGGANNTGQVVSYDTTTNTWAKYASWPAGDNQGGFSFAATISGTTYLYGWDARPGNLYRWKLNGTAANSITYPVLSVANSPYPAYYYPSLNDVFSSATGDMVFTLGSYSAAPYVASTNLSTLASVFLKAEGSGPYMQSVGGLALAPSGMAFCTWPSGGTNNTGTVGAFNPSTNTYTTVLSMPTGMQAYTPPIQGPDGNLWFITSTILGEQMTNGVGKPQLYKITGAPTH